jgi:hypothetical protein
VDEGFLSFESGILYKVELGSREMDCQCLTHYEMLKRLNFGSEEVRSKIASAYPRFLAG